MWFKVKARQGCQDPSNNWWQQKKKCMKNQNFRLAKHIINIKSLDFKCIERRENQGKSSVLWLQDIDERSKERMMVGRRKQNGTRVTVG